ncbi:MAG: hypothetical protein IPH04_00620 [Saprospirales bacterium]|nr:hypothetical protein [Saprospirales bacterium]
MKRLLLGFFLIQGCFFSLSAQKITVSESIGLRDDLAYDILGEWSGQLLLLRDQSVALQVQGFNRQMEKVWEKTLELDKRRPQVLEVVNEKRGFSIAYTFREDLELRLKVHRYDPAAVLLDSATVALVGEELFPISLHSLISEDRSKLLVYKVERYKEIHAFSVDLDSLKLLWQYTFAPEDLDYERDFQQMIVDNQGNMFCILDKDNRKTGPVNHRFEVFYYGSSTALQLKRFEVPMGDKFTYDIRFAYDHLNEQLVGGGLYSIENLARAEGSMFLLLPISGTEEGILQFRELEDAFALSFMGKNFNVKNRGITETSIREIVLRKDGGFLMIGERERIYQRNLSGSRVDMLGGRFVVDYYLDDLFIISCNPDGTVHWEEVFHKKQYSQDDDAMYSSYLLVKTPSNLRLLFNDEIRHENTVSEYVISPTGQFDRNSVMSTDYQNLRLRFRDAVQVSANEVIVPSERRSKLKLVRITY